MACDAPTFIDEYSTRVDTMCRLSEDGCEDALDYSRYKFRTQNCFSVGVDDLLVEGRMEAEITDSLCERCRCKVVRNVIQGQRVLFWNGLPNILKLDVDGWKVTKFL